MSIQATKQIGGDEPIPQSLLELQQLTLGMFLIWDVLGKDYRSQALVESAALFDWARKHKISKKTAVEALVAMKEKFMDEPWTHYIHCRDFKGEGWANTLVFAPLGNQDVLEQILAVMNSRPLKETSL